VNDTSASANGIPFRSASARHIRHTPDAPTATAMRSQLYTAPANPSEYRMATFRVIMVYDLHRASEHCITNFFVKP